TFSSATFSSATFSSATFSSATFSSATFSSATFSSATFGSSCGSGLGVLPHSPPVNKIPIVMMSINLSIFFITYLFFVKIQGGFTPENLKH
ncbi:MAG: pentapeptide repeat-containing protein, partial [Nitrospina sp.]|nr:pentapeptide repeat-containing protein [Nitrospina sp.]